MTRLPLVNALSIGLSLASLVWIGLLPHIFFRAGRRNLQWWLNSAPFWVSGFAVLGVGLDVVTPYLGPTGWVSRASAGLALAVSAGAMVLLAFTLGTHRRPLALWHQPGDVPEHLVTAGPYAYVRHPFYSAFLLALVGCALSAPHWSTLLALAFAAARLNATAALEESRFLSSDLRERYAVYVSRTGRFVPRLRASDARPVRAEERSLEADARPWQQAAQPLGEE